MEERECDGDRAEKSSGEGAVCFGEVWHGRGGENVYRHFYISEKCPRVRVRTSGSCDFLLSQPSPE